jgi:hypothetical protein
MAQAHDDASIPEPSATMDSAPEDIAATSLVVDSIERFELTPDGRHLLVHIPGSVVSVHRSVFRQLLDTLPRAIVRSERILQNNPRFNFAMVSESWELVPIDNGKNLVFRFCLPGGADMQVCVPREQIPGMVDALITAAHLVVIASESTMTVQ